MQTNPHQVDVLVIGAGPSGAVSASILNQKGFKVKILEKQKFPRFVIGESLLPRCMENFHKAGFIEAIENEGFQIKKGAKFINFKGIESEFDFSVQYTKGWTWTWQVQRAKFDELLAREVQKKGVAIEYESTVVDVQFNEDASSITTYMDKNGEKAKIHANFVIDASGYGRVLPRILDLDKPSEFPSRTSLFCHALPKMVQNTEEQNQIAILSHTGETWCWIIPFSDGSSSIGIVGSTEELNSHTGNQEEKIRKWIEEVPALKKRFKDCELLFEPVNISGYSSSVTKHFGKGFVLTGNSAEFIDPVFSSGITFATESGAMAAELVARELSNEEVDWQKEYTDYIQSGVDVFKSFITHWYDGSLQKIIYTKKENEELKKQICSILAGYVWDSNNPLVLKHKRAIPTIAHIVGD